MAAEKKYPQQKKSVQGVQDLSPVFNRVSFAFGG